MIRYLVVVFRVPEQGITQGLIPKDVMLVVMEKILCWKSHKHAVQD